MNRVLRRVRARISREKLTPFLVWICAASLLQSLLHGTRGPCVETFLRDATFSDAALNDERILETENAIRRSALPDADISCDSSSGSMRIVRSGRVSNMCWYANDYLRILRQVHRSKRLHDFIVCDRDCAQADMRIFSLAKSRKIVDVRNRTVSVVPVNVGRHFKWVRHALFDRWTYDSKLPVALWRGVSTSGCWNMHSDSIANRAECARRNLATRWSLHNSSKVDIGITKLVQVSPDSEMKLKILLKKSMTVRSMLKYRYLVSVEGNDVATNLKWALASNSVVFMPEPTRESFILESNLQPWVHYVPLRHDTEDLERKVDYCEENKLHCRQISKAATEYMKYFATRRRLFSLGAQVYERHFEKLANM